MVNQLCGVCKPDSTRPQQSSAEQSKKIVEQEKVEGQHCTLTERLTSYLGGMFQPSQCQKLQKHKVCLPLTLDATFKALLFYTFV